MNRNFISTFCCALLCSLLFCASSQAQTKKLSISDPITPFLAANQVYLKGFLIKNDCSASVSSWLLLDSTKKVLKSNAMTMCRFLFPTTVILEEKLLGQKLYIRYRVADNCSVDSIDYLLETQKQKIRETICYQGVTADLMPTTGEVLLHGSQFISHNSSEAPRLRIEKGIPAFGTSVPTTEMISTGCVGIHSIRVWAKYSDTNWNYCDTYVDIQNNMGATPKNIDCFTTTVICNLGAFPISGKVFTSNGKGIDNAIINGKTADSIAIKAAVKDGKYGLFITPSVKLKFSISKDDNPLNGVSLFDLVLMSKHILGTQSISDKYGLIAADVNNSGKVSTADILELRKMILGIQKEFSNNKSWRFFTKDMKETVVLNNMQRDTIVDFTGVKIGDINGNANAASAPRAAKTHIFELENKDLAEGDIYTLSLKGLDGFAFTLRYDADKLELLSLDENSALLENGVITTAQIGSEFKATFRAKSNVTLSNAIKINSDITKAEAIVEGELQDIALQFSENKTTYEAKIYPNPADNFLHIEISESINGEAIIYNLLGQALVNQMISESEKTTLDIAFLPKGVYLLTLKTDKGNRSEKLIKN